MFERASTWEGFEAGMVSERDRQGIDIAVSLVASMHKTSKSIACS
jgi:hypothetical protein